MPAAALLVDFDGVLRHWPASDEAIERAHGLPDGSIRAAAFSTSLLADLVEGRLSDEDWRTRTAARLRQQYIHADVAGAIAQWSSGLGDIDTELLQVLRDCTPSHRLVLVSNGSTRLRSDLDRLGLGDAFHAVVNSSEIGVAKPAAAFFEIALQRAASTPELALFIDDSPEHVAAARMLGLRAHCYAGVAGVRDFLRECGVTAG
ncbi:HAD-IA family hydrolase [Tahibacter sp.]|uniref:HAD family hydrolase n=1 Tax=Tahibacter sp. TaxID=2056211 RepID=UPI0028C42E3C|nr:HAD-IA family hydrolase [Tahibacter sp.]